MRKRITEKRKKQRLEMEETKKWEQRKKIRMWLREMRPKKRGNKKEEQRRGIT